MCASILNSMATKKDGTAFQPADFNVYFASLMEEKAGKAASRPKMFAEMDTAEQVAHLRKGFGSYVPERLKKHVGLAA